MEDLRHLCEVYSSERARYVGGRLPKQQVWHNFTTGIAQWPLLGMGVWAVDLARTSECVGEVAVTHPPDYPEVELGWLLFNGREGNGYAYEAACAARDYAFRAIRPESLVSYIDPDNHRSIKLAQRLGAMLDDTAPTPNGDPCLVYRYTVPGVEASKVP